MRVERERFKNLKLLVPERHDLALMKVGRGDEHDLASLEEMHHALPFDFELLLERYWETAEYRIGRIEDFRFAFLSFIRRCFGEAELDRAKKAVGRKK